MTMIPLPGAVTYRGRTAECGICGCKSNLWSSNSPRLEGRLVCPGRKKYPVDHALIIDFQNKIERWSELGDYSTCEHLTIRIQHMRVKFKRVESDIKVVKNNA